MPWTVENDNEVKLRIEKLDLLEIAENVRIQNIRSMMRSLHMIQDGTDLDGSPMSEERRIELKDGIFAKTDDMSE